MGLKPTTLDEQLEILKHRNIILPYKSDMILLQYGYYNLVNGYKNPFIDTIKSSALGEDYYKDGTSLDHLVELYKFDSILRQNLLYCIVTVETQMKSLISLYFLTVSAHPIGIILIQNHLLKIPLRKNLSIHLLQNYNEISVNFKLKRGILRYAIL